MLSAVATSRAPSPYLRELAGDARWSLRQLDAAVAEYSAARTLGVDPETGLRLQQYLQSIELDRAVLHHAEHTAARNGWLAAVLAGLAAAALVLLYRMSRMPAAPSVSVSVAAR